MLMIFRLFHNHKHQLRPFLGGLLLWFLLSACSNAQNAPSVRHYSAPELTVNTEPFQQSDCPVDDSGQNNCPPDSPIGQLGCDRISAPGDYLGGMDPSYPINMCWKRGGGGQTPSSEEYVYREGCLLPQYARYVIQRDGKFEVLRSVADLQKVYAPITSENEALSYALAATGLSAYYDLVAPPGFRYFVDKLEDTHVVSSDQGFLVYLYAYKFCGCGPHTTSYVEVLIKPDGSVQETGRTPVFEDPEQDTLCID